MKLNPDLIRAILIDIEDNGRATGYDKEPVIDGYSKDEIFYHAQMMEQAGLVTLRHSKPMNKGFYKSAHIDNITWHGHQFLDLSRNNEIWKKSKETLIEKGISWTFDLGIKLLSKINAERLEGLL